MITWHEDKRRSNIKKHGIDFADCASFFDSQTIDKEDARYDYNEHRFWSLGLLHGSVIVVVWVEREDNIHLISARKAQKKERNYYYENAPI